MKMLYEYTLSASRADFYNITSQVKEAISKSEVADGIAIVYCPHTTAGITVNENADPGCTGEQDAERPTSPDAVRDLLIGLAKAFPDRLEFQHADGHSVPVARVLRAHPI
jgi:secondary thiamine-phosphate synthase enzyme